MTQIEIENKLKEISKTILELGKNGDSEMLRYYQDLESELMLEHETALPF